ncbi:MAG: hypothetical protein FGF50_02180 [Candidatus Brockarchaeota archaeon]|nr:hypothetical protein [Candidatus Brockarchaeota archaeon]
MGLKPYGRFLENRLKTVGNLELQGGYNYWMRFKNTRQEIEVEVLDFKKSVRFLETCCFQRRKI